MSEEEQVKARISELKQKIDILEWDDKKMQINPYKKLQLIDMKKEYDDLLKRLGLF